MATWYVLDCHQLYITSNCSERLWLHARTFLVALENRLRWPGESNWRRTLYLLPFSTYASIYGCQNANTTLVLILVFAHGPLPLRTLPCQRIGRWDTWTLAPAGDSLEKGIKGYTGMQAAGVEHVGISSRRGLDWLEWGINSPTGPELLSTVSLAPPRWRKPSKRAVVPSMCGPLPSRMWSLPTHLPTYLPTR